MMSQNWPTRPDHLHTAQTGSGRLQRRAEEDRTLAILSAEKVMLAAARRETLPILRNKSMRDAAAELRRLDATTWEDFALPGARPLLREMLNE